MASHTFSCIDGHTCGNPVRLVSGGGPMLVGATMLEKRAHFLAEFDWIRKGLMFEPRGHDMMSGTILYPPTRPDCEVAVLFIDTPAGKVDVTYVQEGRHVEEVRLTNVPGFLHSEGLTVVLEGFGEVVVDVAYGGNFYAIVEPQKTYRDMADFSAGELISLSPRLRAALNEKYDFIHPEHPAINGLSHILWTGASTVPGANARNAVFYGDKAIDRSPCGTGTSARMAQLAARGHLQVGDTFLHESIIGSLFKGRIEALVQVAGHPAIVPSVAGWARMTGYNTIFIDDRDPFAHGFVVK